MKTKIVYGKVNPKDIKRLEESAVKFANLDNSKVVKNYWKGDLLIIEKDNKSKREWYYSESKDLMMPVPIKY